MSISTATPTSSSTVLGETAGVMRRFAATENGMWIPIARFGTTTAALQQAIDLAKSYSVAQNEVALAWPAGDYNVTSLDYVGAERITNIALGNVNIYGTDPAGTAIISVDGSAGTTWTRSLNWEGNFAVQIGAGGAYQYGVYIDSLIDSRWKMSVSGAFSANAVYLNYSFDNPQLDFKASNSSGAAVATIKCGSNSVNRNHFNLRVTAAANMAVASIGLELTGNANTVEGDFSSAQIGIKLDNARGTHILAPYMEGVKYGVSFSGNPLGTVVTGGLIEVGTGGAAYDLGSSQNTTIIGGRIFGVAGGSSRTAFALGAACYGLTVLQPDIEDATIDTTYSGTWRGHGGFAKQFTIASAQWLSFPPTQVSSADPNTFDDYEEGTWTPALSAATAGDLAVTYGTRTATYTKKGREVTVSFDIETSAFTHTTAAGELRITGLPFAADASPHGSAFGTLSFSGITKAGYTQFVSHVAHGSSTVVFKASASASVRASVDITDLPSAGTVILSGTITYQAAT